MELARFFVFFAIFCGYAGLLQSPPEARNPKQIQIPNGPIFETRRGALVLVIFLFVLGICFVPVLTIDTHSGARAEKPEPFSGHQGIGKPPNESGQSG
jgi:amino acid transporter